MKNLKQKKFGRRVIKQFKAELKSGLEVPAGEKPEVIEAWTTQYLADKNLGNFNNDYAEKYAHFEISNQIKSIFV